MNSEKKKKSKSKARRCMSDQGQCFFTVEIQVERGAFWGN